MSRIGLKPVVVGTGVDVSVASGVVKVKGPKGTLEQFIARDVKIEVRDGQVFCAREVESKAAKAAHGLMRSLIANMVKGVTTGFSRALDIVGVGYRAEASGQKLTLSVGYSHPVVMQVPEGLKVRADGPTRVVVEGADKQRVGQFAAEIRKVRPPEPYKGKGIRFAEEQIRRKVGKSAAGS
jgi:large subunit ribosomal protein L6